MVRFSMFYSTRLQFPRLLFTFHYGQIFNGPSRKFFRQCRQIYIPLWLDFQSQINDYINFLIVYLHSTMVRFSMREEWKKNCMACLDLHSTMVRFSIVSKIPGVGNLTKFTFHYGQIYYRFRQRRICQREKIYIPLWLDLL